MRIKGVKNHLLGAADLLTEGEDAVGFMDTAQGSNHPGQA
jgi:hypothetical protein